MHTYTRPYRTSSTLLSATHTAISTTHQTARYALSYRVSCTYTYMHIYIYTKICIYIYIHIHGHIANQLALLIRPYRPRTKQHGMRSPTQSHTLSMHRPAPVHQRLHPRVTILQVRGQLQIPFSKQFLQLFSIRVKHTIVQLPCTLICGVVSSSLVVPHR